MRYRLQWFIHLRAYGLRNVNQHPDYALCGVWQTTSGRQTSGGAILSGVYFTPTPGLEAVTRHAVRATATEEDSQNLPHSVLSVERSLVNELSPSPR